MIITEEEIEFLLDEYKMSRREQFARHANKKEMNYFLGMSRGLEVALIKLGVLNTTLDEITQEAYHEVMK